MEIVSNVIDNVKLALEPLIIAKDVKEEILDLLKLLDANVCKVSTKFKTLLIAKNVHRNV
jgi:hypothetical protein